MAWHAPAQPDASSLQVRRERHFPAYRSLVGLDEQLLDRVAIRTQVQVPEPSRRTRDSAVIEAPGLAASPKAAQTGSTVMLLPSRITHQGNQLPMIAATGYSPSPAQPQRTPALPEPRFQSFLSRPASRAAPSAGTGCRAPWPLI